MTRYQKKSLKLISEVKPARLDDDNKIGRVNQELKLLTKHFLLKWLGWYKSLGVVVEIRGLTSLLSKVTPPCWNHWTKKLSFNKILSLFKPTRYTSIPNCRFINCILLTWKTKKKQIKDAFYKNILRSFRVWDCREFLFFDVINVLLARNV